MSSKHRLSASIDADLMGAARTAVAGGQAPNISAWVNAALRLKIEHDRRLQGLAEFIKAYEAEYGEITADEMRLAARRAKSRAVTIREVGSKRPSGRRSRGRRG